MLYELFVYSSSSFADEPCTCDSTVFTAYSSTVVNMRACVVSPSSLAFVSFSSDAFGVIDDADSGIVRYSHSVKSLYNCSGDAYRARLSGSPLISGQLARQGYKSLTIPSGLMRISSPRLSARSSRCSV
jgi:hypothetical protein